MTPLPRSRCTPAELHQAIQDVIAGQSGRSVAGRSKIPYLTLMRKVRETKAGTIVAQRIVPKTIISGFQATGLCPLSLEKISRQDEIHKKNHRCQGENSYLGAFARDRQDEQAEDRKLKLALRKKRAAKRKAKRAPKKAKGATSAAPLDTSDFESNCEMIKCFTVYSLK
ncbi:hypothetical protein DYB25_011383 [Aphanomyces astaci]|uniref:Uncharacterized protein n=1 Tax=Aphanomyces astaci TaxID=112090 RepID=A0A397AKS0_APHAT|nr:hypothetical protein DYB25_011383 [Aphanomyces astaci]RHY77602.1 hypothetical protein DYB34_011923 [Aphanomyces astaci]